MSKGKLRALHDPMPKEGPRLYVAGRQWVDSILINDKSMQEVIPAKVLVTRSSTKPQPLLSALYV